jgi:hypothetical protein
MAILETLKGIITLISVFLLPGWAAISITGIWRRWPPLQRWIVAVGVSIAFYPVLFYWGRLFPNLHLGNHKLTTILILFTLIIIWNLRTAWTSQFKFDRLEWIAIAVIGATIFTRLIILADRPYPAWSDSLHHTLITNIVANTGQLPTTLEPYAPTPLNMYHLGLYAITGVFQQLAQVPAHKALLITAQVLNGLCGVGVYLVLDRMSGRVGAIVGLIIAGLISFQPAWYVNWGRFTQLSAQIIILITALLTYELIKDWHDLRHRSQLSHVWNLFLVTILNASIFFLHFRVAGMYLALIGIVITWMLISSISEKRGLAILWPTVIIGGLTFVMISIVLFPAFTAYIDSMAPASALSRNEFNEAAKAYYSTPIKSLFSHATTPLLAMAAGMAMLVVILVRDKLGILTIFWMIALIMIGNFYRLGIAPLAFTNLGAIAIMFYLPISMLIGLAVEDILHLIPTAGSQSAIYVVLVVGLLLGILGGYKRVVEKDDYRYFMTEADAIAMKWIRENTPRNAVFAINSVMWTPSIPHGTDGGYWIPYFTNRQTTAGTMLLDLGPEHYQEQLVQLSLAEERLVSEPESIHDLCSQGVEFLYIGPIGDYTNSGLDPLAFLQTQNASLVYRQEGVFIFNLCEHSDSE